MIHRISLIVLAVLPLFGCSEHVRVATTPPGARLYLDDRRDPMLTPYTLSVPRDEIRDIPYRIELDHYRTVSGTLRKRVATGRVFGAVFTLGILYAFRSPFYIESLNEVLAVQPMPAQGAAPRSAPVEERLRKLQQLKDDEVIPQKDYDAQKQRILDESR